MPLSTAPSAPTPDSPGLSFEERVARIKRMNLEADEMMAEANRFFAAERLKDAYFGRWMIYAQWFTAACLVATAILQIMIAVRQ